MDIIAGMLSDVDMQYMSDSLICAFGDVLNELLAKRFKTYMTNPQANEEVVSRLNNLIGVNIKILTFSDELVNNGVRDTVIGLKLDTLAYQPCDYGFLHETLEYVLENSRYMRAVLSARSKESYDNLIAEAGKFDAESANKILVYPKLKQRIMANKKIFYNPHERSTVTRLGCILRRLQDCTVGLRGTEYLQYCLENNVCGYRRSEF